MTVKWEKKFRGSHKEIGVKLGEYWRERYPKKSDEWLNRGSNLAKKCAKNGFGQLRKKIEDSFPEIWEEVEGMAVGVGKPFDASLNAIFALSLGETESMCCSSVVRKTPSGYLLGHNEEEDHLYPLCFADVTLDMGNGEKTRFASVSYPFQLFGSSCGMTQDFAFQGNSIGTSRDVKQQLEESLGVRIPKTYLSRKMLELSDIDEITDMFKEYPITLPNHHYVVFHDTAYSLEVAPALVRPYGNDIRLCEIGENFDAHTNHFLNSRELARIWMKKSWQQGSTERLGELQSMRRVLPSLDGLINDLEAFRNNKRKKITSATLVCELTKSGSSIRGRHYDWRQTHEVEALTLKRHRQTSKGNR